MSHSKKLPIIEPFAVDALGLEFVDRRLVVDGGLRVALAAWTDHVASLLSDRGIGAGDVICQLDGEKMERDINAFHAAQEIDPSLEWSEWVEAGGTMEREISLDPSRAEVFFCARELATGDWVGGMSLSNIDIETDTPAGVVCGGLIFPGIPDGGDIVATWVALLTDFLSTTHLFDDARSFDVVEYHIIDLPDLGLHAATDAALADLADRMSSDFDVLRGADGNPLKTTIRRRGV